MPTQSYYHSVFYMILSASFLAGSFLFTKLGVEDLPFLVFLFLRFLGPLLILTISLVFLGSFKKTICLNKSFLSHVLRALSVIGAQYSLVFYLTQNSLLNAAVLINASPLFIPFLEKIFLKHRMGRSTWIALIVSALGMLLILQPEKGIFNPLMVVGLFAALMQSISQVLYSLHAQTESQASSAFYLFLLGSIFSFIVLLGAHFFGGYPISFIPSSMGDIDMWMVLIALSLCISVTQVLRGIAYAKGGKAGNLAPFLYISVLLSGLFDWIVFRHLPNIWTVLGAFLVLLGAVLKVYLRMVFLKKQ